MKELEKYLNSKIGISNNKNLELLKLFFTKSQLDDLSNRTIAVVGTNGKTSTVNFIHQLLKKNNKSSLMFTSPHLVEYTERIQSDKNLNLESNLDLVKDFEEKNNTILGYFETLFLLASLLFLDSELDYLFVRALKSGAEVRPGTSPYLALLEAKYNQATDLSIADFRSKQANFDGINESLLLESKAAGARFKGDLTARTENIKGFGSLLSTGYEMDLF